MVGETAEVEAELYPGARAFVGFGGGVSMRSPGGGPILRGVGGVVEEGNMAHALRGWVTASVLFLF